jgi:hypothetical protein
MLLFNDMETLIGLTFLTNPKMSHHQAVLDGENAPNFYDIDDIEIKLITRKHPKIGRYSIDDKFRIHDRIKCSCKGGTENRAIVQLVDEMGLPITKPLITFGMWNKGDNTLCLTKGECFPKISAGD